ncbi:nuclear factor of activated T-cells, cytoplasmic 3-like [Neosynchiropus ocellatus]
MSSLDCADELDFRLLFEDNGRFVEGSDLNVVTAPSSTQTLHPVSQEPRPLCLPADYQHVAYQHVGPQFEAQGNTRSFDCPSIQITSIAPNNHVEQTANQENAAVGGAEGGYPEPSWSRDQLYLPLDPCYRDPTLCPSPCSSLSSRSWMSDVSSCESYSHVYDDVDGDLCDPARLALASPLGSPGCGGGAFGVELWQQKYQSPSAFSPSLSPHQSPRQSPCHSPRTSVTEESWLHRRPTSRPSSRPTSPCGKRRHCSAEPRAHSSSPHHSPTRTPGASPMGSVTEDTWLGSPASAAGLQLLSGYQELNVPSKTRRTSGTQLSFQGDAVLEELRSGVAFQESPTEESREQEGVAELFLPVPSHFSWTKPKPGNPPLYSPSSPPSLDTPLPSQFDQYELKLEVQPRSYHRAHYETEGSRGSIKATTGGHPVVKLSGFCQQPVAMLLFIGTADDRYLRPHSFYQVHRVTGKTVTTNCHEKILEGTKVLEITLLPENDMSVSIDCAGILKLRNADIELKKGETDIGRKNTRVRVVFRVALPQPDGQILWLQTSTIPVECSQRSGQELPHVESFRPGSCSVDGGEELHITGSNISSQSRVVFLERGPDGRVLWEVEANVLPEKSSTSGLMVLIPPYNLKTVGPVQVQFYVSNGKRKRSPAQSFTFLPRDHRLYPAVKQELLEQDPRASHDPPVLLPSLPSDLYYGTQNAPRLCHPQPLQQTLTFPPLDSLPPQPSWLPVYTLPTTRRVSPAPPPVPSALHHSSSFPPVSGSLAPRSSTNHPHLSSAALHPPAGGSSRNQPLPQKERPLSRPEEVLNIKQEPGDQPAVTSLGLQEITLDDVNEIIDRDIRIQFHRFAGDTAVTFCGAETTAPHTGHYQSAGN